MYSIIQKINAKYLKMKLAAYENKENVKMLMKFLQKN